MISIYYFTEEKVGEACSYLGAIGLKVGGALVPPALWLSHCCSGHAARAASVSYLMDS